MVGSLLLFIAMLLCYLSIDPIWAESCRKYHSSWACWNYILGCLAALLAAYLLVLVAFAHVFFGWSP